MSAREALIRAYAFSTLKRDAGGDFDIGAKGTHDPIRRKSRGRFTDPEHHRQTRQKAINTTNIVMNGMIAGKIIAAAEGFKKYQGAYSRVYYSDSPRRADHAILGAYLTKRLLETQKGTGRMLGASSLILAYCSNNTLPFICDNVIKNELDIIIGRLDNKVLRAVGICVKEIDTPH